jgi:hypothetical protein
VSVAVWGNLHFRARRETTLTVVRRSTLDPATPKEPPQILWCIWVGATLPPLAQLALLYLRRFAMEHGFRFDKQDLLWTTTRLRTPEALQRWTDIVSIVHNLVGIACSEASGLWRPWEPRGRPATLRQVRRALGRIYADLGSPVPAPQPRGYSPGRAPGTCPPRPPRYPVIRTSAKRPKKRRPAA